MSQCATNPCTLEEIREMDDSFTILVTIVLIFVFICSFTMGEDLINIFIIYFGALLFV